jgi:hypothetical protein
MSGLTALVDTLLATRLAQRVDLVPLKPEIEIAGPGPVSQVEEVINDVRLPSRAAMLQQLGPGLLKDGGNSYQPAPAVPRESVTLSVAARAVSAILDVSSGASAKITGTEPLWPKAQAPLAPALSATLARTVANSGLFYESHLEQFAAGTRTLAQLAQEPQARLDATVKVALALSAADSAVQNPGASGTASGAARPADATGLPAASPVPAGAGDADEIDGGKPGGAAPVPNSVPGSAASSPDSDRPAQGSDPAGLHKIAYQSIQQANGSEGSIKNQGASALDALRHAPGLAGIHPDAVALVRQQLDLLAQPVFRWGGEAWPGVPMNWEIHEEQQEREGRQTIADNEASPRSWSTRLALTLPMLKDIEVRISLAGNSLQLHLAASENATRDLMGEARAELPNRLNELGLQLTGLQIGALRSPAATQDRPEDDVAR